DKAGEQRGLSCAVRADDRRHLAALERHAHALEHRLAAECDGDVGDGECAHAVVRRKLISRIRKNGPPSTDIATPSFSSAADGMMRTTISAARTMTAPAKALGIKVALGREPTNGRTICGVNKPTKAIAPVTATLAPAARPTPSTTRSRMRLTCTPMDRAVA